VLDESGSLGSFLDATIARIKQMGNTTVTPVSSPESRECPSDNLEDAYIELDDDFIDEFHATSDAGAIRDLLARHDVRYKLSPDARRAVKYFPASAQHAALQKIFDFEQVKGEKLPESWARFCSLIRALPGEPLPKNELLDIFYNGY
jgi:hypothetical protein